LHGRTWDKNRDDEVATLARDQHTGESPPAPAASSARPADNDEAALIAAVIAINAWNRIAVTFRYAPEA